jgi:adenylate cyclase
MRTNSGGIVEKVKQYILKYFEQFFVFGILCSVFIITYFVPQKITFLNFYFLPIILGGYFLGSRQTILGAVFCILMVSVYVGIYPDFFKFNPSPMYLYLHISAWGGFLILSGAVVGSLHDSLKGKIDLANKLNQHLETGKKELSKAHSDLNKHTENLEITVKKRTKELEQSKQSVEHLKQKVEEALYTTMDATVAKLMIEGRLRNEKRSISVMFTDLVGFTTYSEDMSPEIVIRDLNRYFADMEPIFFNFRGHIDKYQGDGIMSEFGAPLDSENYRLCAVLAGMVMQKKMAESEYPWKMRIGIASGAAIMGFVGSRRQSYTSIGDVVNLSSRLEKICPPGGVLIDKDTFENVKRFVDAKICRSFFVEPGQEDLIARQFQELHLGLTEAKNDKQKGALYFEIAELHSQVEEFDEAIKAFKQAMKLLPDDTRIKVAFAEVTVKHEDSKKISVKGKHKRIVAYEVLELKDVLLDRDKIPQHVYDKYIHCMKLLLIPEEALLPIEAIDHSIGHSKVVGFISYAIASEMGLSDKEKENILYAGFAADIGKEIVPHHLLNRREASFNTRELDEIHKHASEGPNILKKMGYREESMFKLIRHSHENFNGSGFPDGLKGEDIPLGSRIIFLADAYDALTSWRPYGDKWERKPALDELRKGAQRGLYDPHILQQFLSLLH